MRELRILFMGTPEFATTILNGIIENNFNVIGVVTAPDKPAGRGRNMHQSHVKKYAIANNLRLLQPTNLKAEEFQEELKMLNPNVIVVVAFRMLPKSVWQLPEFGTFNLHASLLPQYRGAAPIHWAIINGDEKTGVSTFFIDEKIDTGAMILQQECEIKPDDTVGQLHDRLMVLGKDAVIETLLLIANDNVTTEPQKDTGDLKSAKKLNSDNTRIDWSQSLTNVYNKIRGLNPFPVAWTMLHNGDKKLRMKLYGVHNITEAHSYSSGKLIIEDGILKIAVKDGYIIVDELQLPNKRKMKTKDLLNGFSFTDDAYVL